MLFPRHPPSRRVEDHLGRRLLSNLRGPRAPARPHPPGRRGGRRGYGRWQEHRPCLSLHQARRGARHLEGRALRDRVPADDDHREERALSPAAHLHAGSAVRREHRHGIDQRDPRAAHGRRHRTALRRRPDGARLLPRAHGGRERPRRPRRADRVPARDDRRRAGARAAGDAARHHRAPHLRGRDARSVPRGRRLCWDAAVRGSST